MGRQEIQISEKQQQTKGDVKIGPKYPSVFIIDLMMI